MFTYHQRLRTRCLQTTPKSWGRSKVIRSPEDLEAGRLRLGSGQGREYHLVCVWLSAMRAFYLFSFALTNADIAPILPPFPAALRAITSAWAWPDPCSLFDRQSWQGFATLNNLLVHSARQVANQRSYLSALLIVYAFLPSIPYGHHLTGLPISCRRSRSR
jgi:hypothetical protein